MKYIMQQQAQYTCRPKATFMRAKYKASNMKHCVKMNIEMIIKQMKLIA